MIQSHARFPKPIIPLFFWLFFSSALVAAGGCAASGGTGETGPTSGSPQDSSQNSSKEAGAGKCGAPLVNGRSWCTTAPGSGGQQIVTIITFSHSCSMTSSQITVDGQGQQVGTPNSWDALWTFDGKQLKFEKDGPNGGPDSQQVSQMGISFSANGQTMTAHAESGPIAYRACNQTRM